MKKFCFALCLLFGGMAYALPVGNPAEASLFYCRPYCNESCFCLLKPFRFGFYGDYVFNRHMETVHHKDIDATQIFTNAGYVAANLYNRADVFATFGASRLSLNTSLGAFNALDPHPLFELESGTSFSYSIGARATIFCYKCASIGIVGQYFSTKPNVKRLYIASGAVSYPGDALRTHYSEWQIGVGASCRYNDFFVPYVAVKYAESFWKINDGRRFVIEDNTGTFLFNLKNQKRFGYAIGLTFLPCEQDSIAVTAEVRFAAEKAVHVNAQLRF